MTGEWEEIWNLGVARDVKLGNEERCGTGEWEEIWNLGVRRDEELGSEER